MPELPTAHIIRAAEFWQRAAKVAPGALPPAPLGHDTISPVQHDDEKAPEWSAGEDEGT